MTITTRLEELNISLPTSVPLGLYRPAIRSDNQVYVSGQVAIHEGFILHPGRLGEEVTTEQGVESARICAINALGALYDLLGSLEDLRLIRTVGYVAATADFSEHPSVINGASELLRDVFGTERGIGARVAFGVASLPAHSPVELELLMEIY